MSKMVDRAARALEAECTEMEPNDKYRFHRLARAVIVAMREPTEAMLTASANLAVTKEVNSALVVAAEHGCGAIPSASWPDHSPIHQWWRAMIDEALR